MAQHAEKGYIIDPDKANAENELFVIEEQDLAFHFINIGIHKNRF
jgi:hypothetical protein